MGHLHSKLRRTSRSFTITRAGPHCGVCHYCNRALDPACTITLAPCGHSNFHFHCFYSKTAMEWRAAETAGRGCPVCYDDIERLWVTVEDGGEGEDFVKRLMQEDEEEGVKVVDRTEWEGVVDRCRIGSVNRRDVHGNHGIGSSGI